jgi:hypothetical protein
MISLNSNEAVDDTPGRVMKYQDVMDVVNREGRRPNEREIDVILQYLKAHREICRVCDLQSTAVAIKTSYVPLVSQ